MQIKAVSQCLDLFDPSAKRKLFQLTFARAIVGLLDLLGLWLLGELFSKLSTSSTGTPGFLNYLPVKFQDNWVMTILLIVVISFVFKSLASIAISEKVAKLVAKEESRVSAESARVIINGFNKLNLSSSPLDIAYGLAPSTSAAISRVGVGFSNVISDLFTFIVTLGFLLLLNPVIALGAVFYLGLIGFIVGKIINNRSRLESEGYAKNTLSAMSDFQLLVSIQKEAHVFRLIEEHLNRFFIHKDMAAKNLANLNILGILPRYVMDVAIAVALLLFGFFALNTSQPESLSFLGVLIAALMRLGPNLLSVQGYLASINAGLGESNRYFNSVKPAVDKITKQSLLGPVTELGKDIFQQVKPEQGYILTQVSFSYPDSREEVFDEISISLNRTGSYALIGPSGAGKTTLVDLLLGILEPTKGKIYFKGQELFQSNLRFSYVPQKPNLINGSFRENLTLEIGKTRYTDLEISHALKFAGIEHLVNQLPFGLDTDLSSMGSQFSGGEIQRIGLARAVLRDSEVYIFDEYTSALDVDLENELIEKVKSLSDNSLVIIIAHRYSTLKHVEYVIDLGKDVIKVENMAELNFKNFETKSFN